MDTANLVTLVPLIHWLINGILVTALLGKLLLLYVVVAKFSDGWQERIMRSIASACGALIYLGAKEIGVAIPVFMLQALTIGGAYLTGLVGALLPGAAGFVVAWHATGYLNSRNKRRNLVGMRILAMTMSVVVLLFADTYIAAFTHQANGPMLLPNLAFTLAIILYAVFRYHPLPDGNDVPQPVTAQTGN